MPDSPIPVILATDGIYPHSIGGMQMHSRSLAESLARSGKVKLTVLHPHVDMKVFEDELNIEEVIIPPAEPAIQYIIDCYRYSRKVKQVLLQRPEAIIYSQGLSVWSGIEKFKNRIIVNPHGLEPYQTLTSSEYLKALPFRMIFNFILKRTGHVVSLGGKLSGILARRVSHGAEVIILPNATTIKSETTKNFDGSVTKVLFVGRFAFNKGLDILIEAIRNMNESGSGEGYRFDLVGKGPLFEKYKSSYSAPNLRLHGFASDEELEALYQSHHVLVLPTLFEGMPTVVLEAMAHKMSIVVTDVGATRDMVDDSNGYIIKKRNVNSLVNAFESYRNSSPERKKEISENSFAKVKREFTWDVVAQAHLQLFDGIIENSK